MSINKLSLSDYDCDSSASSELVEDPFAKSSEKFWEMIDQQLYQQALSVLKIQKGLVL